MMASKAACLISTLLPPMFGLQPQDSRRTWSQYIGFSARHGCCTGATAHHCPAHTLKQPASQWLCCRAVAQHYCCCSSSGCSHPVMTAALVPSHLRSRLLGTAPPSRARSSMGCLPSVTTSCWGSPSSTNCSSRTAQRQQQKAGASPLCAWQQTGPVPLAAATGKGVDADHARPHTTCCCKDGAAACGSTLRHEAVPSPAQSGSTSVWCHLCVRAMPWCQLYLRPAVAGGGGDQCQGVQCIQLRHCIHCCPEGCVVGGSEAPQRRAPGGSTRGLQLLLGARQGRHALRHLWGVVAAHLLGGTHLGGCAACGVSSTPAQDQTVRSHGLIAPCQCD